MFSAFIWCTYCLCRIKILNFQKFSSRKLKNFHAQTRLLPGHGTEKLQNIGWFSDILWVNKDASFHLRLCLIHLDEKWGLNNPKTTASWFLPPQFLNGPKSLAWLGLKTCLSSMTAKRQYANLRLRDITTPDITTRTLQPRHYNPRTLQPRTLHPQTLQPRTLQPKDITTPDITTPDSTTSDITSPDVDIVIIWTPYSFKKFQNTIF